MLTEKRVPWYIWKRAAHRISRGKAMCATTEEVMDVAAMATVRELEFLGNQFVVPEELAEFNTVRKEQEQAAFEIEERYLAIKDKMLEEFVQLVQPEADKYTQAVQNDIKTLQQAANEGMNDLAARYQAEILPEIGRRLVFKHTKSDGVTSKDIADILFASPTKRFLEVYDGFFENVYGDMQQVEDLRNGLRERRELASQRSTPTYSGFGFGFRGTLNAAAGAAAANLGMGLLEGISSGLSASSDAELVRQRAASGLARAKQDLLIMGMENVKKLLEICKDYLGKDMQEELDALGRTPYRKFSQEEQAVIDLKNANYDEAYAEGDIDEKRYVAHIFRTLGEEPYNLNHYCHLVKAAFALGDREGEARILDFAGYLGLARAVRQTLEWESRRRLDELKGMGENSLSLAEQKLAAAAPLYGTAAAQETDRLRRKVACLKNMPRARENAAKFSRLFAANGTLIRPDQTIETGDPKLKTGHLKQVVSFAYSKGCLLTVHADGTVSCIGSLLDRPEVKKWKNIASICGEYEHCAGLKKDGTVVATGRTFRGACDVDGWRNIVAIDCANSYTVGVRADGTVAAAGQFRNASSREVEDYISSWTDIVAVSAAEDYVLGLKKDGTVVARGLKSYIRDQCDVDEWWGIVAVSAGGYHSVGLRADGTVVAVGYNNDGECDVGSWRDIVAVAAGNSHTIGLKADGTLVAVGSNKYGQCNISGTRLWSK